MRLLAEVRAVGYLYTWDPCGYSRALEGLNAAAASRRACEPDVPSLVRTNAIDTLERLAHADNAQHGLDCRATSTSATLLRRIPAEHLAAQTLSMCDCRRLCDVRNMRRI